VSVISGAWPPLAITTIVGVSYDHRRGRSAGRRLV